MALQATYRVNERKPVSMKGNTRLAFALCLVTVLLAPVSEGADRKESSDPWIVSAQILRNGGASGSGVYLASGLIITAAHLTAVDANMSVSIAGVVLPAKVLKQGSFEDVDLSVLSVDEGKLPASIGLIRMQLCEAPPWPGDPVIVVDAVKATESHIVSPEALPYKFRNKFSTLIGDVATTGNSGSGVFDPNRKCLLGIMSRKFTSHATGRDKDVAKYFVPAVAIRDFMLAP
jgi:Trypsin-like peptidase domain